MPDVKKKNKKNHIMVSGKDMIWAREGELSSAIIRLDKDKRQRTGVNSAAKDRCNFVDTSSALRSNMCAYSVEARTRWQVFFLCL